MTVAESILKIRQVGINKETTYTCYVTEKRKPDRPGRRKKELLLPANPRRWKRSWTRICCMRIRRMIRKTARTITKYGLIALPIVDHDAMVGIVNSLTMPWLSCRKRRRKISASWPVSIPMRRLLLWHDGIGACEEPYSWLRS